MVIRYVTVPPVMAAALILITYFSNKAFVGSVWDLVAALGFLCVMPTLSYPVHAIIPPLKRRGRKCQRNLAIIFSVTGYACGLVHAFAFHAAPQLSALYLTYAISGALIAICTFVFKFKASGHASGVAGPVAGAYAYGKPVLRVRNYSACRVRAVQHIRKTPHRRRIYCRRRLYRRSSHPFHGSYGRTVICPIFKITNQRHSKNGSLRPSANFRFFVSLFLLY